MPSGVLQVSRGALTRTRPAGSGRPPATLVPRPTYRRKTGKQSTQRTSSNKVKFVRARLSDPVQGIPEYIAPGKFVTDTQLPAHRHTFTKTHTYRQIYT